MIRKLLVANRGEIAVRVMRTAREMGIATVAVHSQVERFAPHVLAADEAVELGPAPSAESYLRGERIIGHALRLEADAIHPGYGFLSENAAFARACAEAGLIFVGPAPETIEAMGSKTRARETMRRAGVPVVPGSEAAIDDGAHARRLAQEIGYPLMIKAAAGGGGKGMRRVEDDESFAAAFDAARREALGAFGDGSLYLERYLLDPHHVEVQILGDGRGRVIHLGERECSVQRRHQKVVEESPSPFLTPELREEICAVAVRAGEAVSYLGAGTVEFLVDGQRRFYFLEMNTRLQVEHPVTEWVTGVDLVREQLRIAAGEPLAMRQEEIRARGHSIECRICAEDPRADFLPDTGRIEVHAPPGGPGVRLDSGVEAGDEVGVHYDPLLAKLTVWGADRQAAIARMARALDEYRLQGPATNIAFCRWVMDHEVFRGGVYTTHFIADHFRGQELDAEDPGLRLAAEAAALLGRLRCAANRPQAAPAAVEGSWRWQHRRQG
jgi:acetyl-CoA carboxylase biotin carboxylase subunit